MSAVEKMCGRFLCRHGWHKWGSPGFAGVNRNTAAVVTSISVSCTRCWKMVSIQYRRGVMHGEDYKTLPSPKADRALPFRPGLPDGWGLTEMIIGTGPDGKEHPRFFVTYNPERRAGADTNVSD